MMSFKRVQKFFVFSVTTLILGIGGVGSMLAQSIQEIEVEGNERLSDEAVIQYIGSQKDQEFAPSQIRQDLRALYNTGLFKDIRIDVEDVAGGVRVIIVVEEKDYIQKLIFEGNDVVDDDDLSEGLDLDPPFLWDEALVRASLEKLRKLYRDKGYYLVTVRTEVITEGRQKHLKFQIDEGSKVEVKKIYLQGNTVFSDDRLKAAMISREGGFWAGITRRGQYNEDLLVQVDGRRMQMEYLRKGFAFARVDSPSITFTPDRTGVIVSYNIFEGEQYSVGDIRFSGDLDFIDPEKTLEDLKSKKGEIWNFNDIQADIQTIQDLYGNEGYAYANVSPSWVIADEENRILDIEYRIDKGSLVYFGRVDVQGNLETLDRIIRRELEFVEGELFNVTKYRDSQRNLERLGYFESVKFIQKDILEEQKMDVLIEVIEKQTGTLTLGASFSSFDQFGIQGSVSKVNLFGRGYDVSLSALFSGRRQVFNFFFRNPRVNDSKLSFSFRAFNTEVQSLDETAIKERGGSLTLGHPIAENWRISGTYGLRDININIRDVIEQYYPDSFGLDSTLSVGLTRDTLNAPEVFLPSAGSLNSITSTHGSKYLGSDLSYWKLDLISKKYFTPFESDTPFVGNSVLSFGLRANYLRGTEDRSTPYNERFIPGGIYSIRGHLFRSLGPSVYTPFNLTGRRSDDGELRVTKPEELRIGGNKQVILNVEYLFDIFREAKIKGVIFFDIGNTYAERDYEIWNTRESAGFGFRWFSPLGPLRFEWGIPLDRKEGEDSVLFDFSIGAPF